MTLDPRITSEPRRFDAGGDALLFDEGAVARRFPASGTRPSAWMGDGSAQPSGYKRDGQVAVVSIEGPLDQKGGWWWDGYDTIVRRVTNALGDPQVGAVLLVIDSPGGVVAGCWEAVRVMRLASKATGKPIVVYVDEMACSAAYALSCAAEAVVIPKSGMAGSIGVIATAVSYAEQLEKEGIRVAVLSTGKRKADGHPALPLSDEAKARMQARIDEYGRQFFALVAEVRPLTAANIKALEADVFVGQAAVDAKLADQLGTFGDALALARSKAKSSTVAVKATTPAGEIPMKTVFAALGLPEDATEAQVLVAIQNRQDQSKSIVAALGCTTAAEALGKAEGLLKTSLAYDQLASALREREGKERAGKAESAYAETKARGALPPTLEASIRASFATVATDEDLARLTGLLAALPVTLPSAEDKRPEGGSSLVSKGWDEMKPAERVALKRSNPEAYRAMREAAEQQAKTARV